MGNKPIVHAPIATGSIEPRDIRDRFADFVNLKDFGAVGDGVTDDAAAWSAWETALKTRHGIGLIPSGDYALGESGVHFPYGMICNNTRTDDSYDTDWPVFDTEFQQHIYVSPSGDDTNNGLTENSPIYTINQAIRICKSSPMPATLYVVHVAAGTYDEGDLSFGYLSVEIRLNGDTTINSNIQIFDGFLRIQKEPSVDSDPTLTINNGTTTNTYALIVVDSNSTMFVSVPLVLIPNKETSFGILATNVGHLEFQKSVTVQIKKYISNDLFISRYNSFINFGSNTTLTILNDGQRVLNGFYANHNSEIILNCTVTVGTNAIKNCIAYAKYCGLIYFLGSNNTLKNASDSTAYYCIDTNCNSVMVLNNCTIELNHASQNQSGITCYQNSLIEFSNITINVGTKVNDIISAIFNSVLFFAGTIKINGSCTSNISSWSNSYVRIRSNCTMSGSVTGKRYDISKSGIIDTEGSGANKIPGSTAGTVGGTSGSFYF